MCFGDRSDVSAPEEEIESDEENEQADGEEEGKRHEGLGEGAHLDEGVYQIFMRQKERIHFLYFLSQKKNSRSRITIRISMIRVPDRPDEPDRSGRSGRESGSRLGMFGTALRCGAVSSPAGCGSAGSS